MMLGNHSPAELGAEGGRRIWATLIHTFSMQAEKTTYLHSSPLCGCLGERCCQMNEGKKAGMVSDQITPVEVWTSISKSWGATWDFQAAQLYISIKEPLAKVWKMMGGLNWKMRHKVGGYCSSLGKKWQRRRLKQVEKKETFEKF